MSHRADYNFVMKYGEVTPDGVAVYDLNSRRFVYMNHYLRYMLGFREAEKLPDSTEIMKLVHPDDLEYAERLYRELLSIGCIATASFRISLRDGTARTISAEVLWLEESYTFALFVKDISAARQYEEFLVKISAQKDTLLDTLLHNLSGPLQLSRDVSERLRELKKESSEVIRLTEIVQQSTAHCIDIIIRFLVEEHSASADVVVKKVRFSLIEKTNLMLNMLRELHSSKRIELQVVSAEVYITSDPVKYCQIIHNLLSNALKFTGKDALIRVSIESDNDHVTISVSDNGTGVPEEIGRKLFRGKVNGREGCGGEPSQGMGLLLSARLAQRIGAKIQYKPGSVKGSVFSLTIPVL